MKFRVKSIRATLTLWYTVLVISTLLLFGGTSYFYTSKTLSENLDLSLRNEVRWVRDFIQPQASKVKPSKASIDAFLEKKERKERRIIGPTEEDTTAQQSDEIWNQIFRHTLHSPKKTYIQFQDRNGTIIYRSYNLGADSLAVRDTVGLNSTVVMTGWLNGEQIRIAGARDKNFLYLVGYPLGELRDLLESLYIVFIILLPIALAVSVFGGLALAHKSLRPVDEITRRTRRITAENLDQELPRRAVDDEIGRLTSTINDMIARLHSSFAQVQQFSADASHELRTPLTVMRGEIELALQHPRPPAEYRAVLESAHEEILRMSSVIENLLTLAKADQGIINPEFTEVDLVALLEDLHEDARILAEGKRITVKLHAPTPLTIVGDRSRLHQLFLNLLDNAIKYTPEGGSVRMSLEREEGNAKVTVEDTGIGIPQEDLGKIFDRFYRVDKARSRELGGTGLGLSIAKWIAELHRGSITVASELHAGTAFTVVLPVN